MTVASTIQPVRETLSVSRGRGTGRSSIRFGRGRGALDKGVAKIEARQLTLVYAARHREDTDDVNVIAGMFFIYSLPFFALINISSTHSYITNTVSVKLNIIAECTTSIISVTSLLGQPVRVYKVYKRVSLEIQGVMFSADLIELTLEFNLILGMD